MEKRLEKGGCGGAEEELDEVEEVEEEDGDENTRAGNGCGDAFC